MSIFIKAKYDDLIHY